MCVRVPMDVLFVSPSMCDQVIKVGNAQAPKVEWPPSQPDNVETIAASYVESSTSAKVRLFNLSPDTKVAGMQCAANGTKEIVSNVDFSLGSDWVSIASAQDKFTIRDDLSSSKLTSVQYEPPAAPLGFTVMLLGVQDGKGTDHAIRGVPLIDAPEGGVCKPTATASASPAAIWQH